MEQEHLLCIIMWFLLLPLADLPHLWLSEVTGVGNKAMINSAHMLARCLSLHHAQLARDWYKERLVCGKTPGAQFSSKH